MFQLASFRPQLPDTAFSVTATNGGALNGSGSLYIFIQQENLVGRNLLSSPRQISYTTGQKIKITLNADCRRSGEEVFNIAVSASTSSNPETAKQIAIVSLKENDLVTNKALPLTIELVQNDHILLGGEVASFANLPTQKLNGTISKVVDENKNYIWNGSNWAITSQSIDTYLEVPSSDTNTESIIDLPAKTGLDSLKVKYWYLNGYEEDSSPVIPSGSKFTSSVFVNGENKTAWFSNRIKVRQLGYVRRGTGELFTTAIGSGTIQTWATDTPIEIYQDIDRGYGVVWEVWLSYNNLELPQLSAGADIAVAIVLQGEIGTPTDLDSVIGEVILPDLDRLLIVPNARLSGTAIAKGYRFNTTSNAPLVGLLIDENIQHAILNLATGVVRLSTDPTLQLQEVKRAIVSTQQGIQSPSAASNQVTVASGNSLSIDLLYPDFIRGDYPDESIRLKNAELSPKYFRVYVQRSTLIYRANNLTSIVPTGQTILIPNLSDYTQVTSIPTNNDPTFGLFGYNAPIASIVATGGTLTAGNYKIYIAYEYPSPNSEITKISHNTALGCIPVLSQTLLEVLGQAKYWMTPLLNAQFARALPLSELVNDRVWLVAGTPYRWIGNATGADDGVNFIAPTAIGSYEGRLVPIYKTDYTPATLIDREGNIVVSEDGRILNV